MGMPRWWAERRYGLLLDASLASVPAWAPIGAPAERYRRHLGEVREGGDERPDPLVEVLAHHNDRWGHLDRYDDFVELLTFDRFDAEEWAALAGRAGAGYTVLSVKHHDGWCWWDAEATDRTLVQQGPRRNVLAEYAAASERNELVLGAFYALDDWSDPVRSTDRLAARVRDLVERFGVQLLCGAIDRNDADEHPAAGSVGLDDGTIERLAAPDGDIIIDDAFGELCGIDRRRRSGMPAPREVITICGDPPADIARRPWQLCRPVGRSIGHNRTEAVDHQMTADDIVSLLTEVVAKGGNLTLGVGLTADGTIAEHHRTPLVEAGSWIRDHHDVLSEAQPWSTWGDASVRYWRRGDDLYAVDVAGDGTFAALDGDDRIVERIVRVTPELRRTSTDRRPDGAPQGTAEVAYAQDSDGVRLLQRRNPASPDDAVAPVVYRIDLRASVPAVELFERSTNPPVELAPIVEGALPGSIIQLGEGVYAGPADLPAGTIVRGLGPDRTTITTTDGELLVGRDGRLEHLRVASETCSLRPLARPAVRVAGGATVLGCRIDGVVTIEADDTTIRASQLCELRAHDVDRVLVSRSQFVGDQRGTAIAISGGADHEIDSCEFSGYLRAIHITESTGVGIAGNHIESRQWGIHLERTDHAHVHRNLMVSTMRAVDVDGGSAALVDGNAVFGGDSGCVLRGGATDCEVSGNHWERCRIGMIRWDTPQARLHGNHVVDLYEPDNELVVGP